MPFRMLGAHRRYNFPLQPSVIFCGTLLYHACSRPPVVWVTIMSEASVSSTSKSGLLVFAGGILIGSVVAATVAYAYASAYQDERSRNRRGKGNQRYCDISLFVCLEVLK